MPTASEVKNANLADVGLHEAAVICGKSVVTLKSWFNKGCPVIARGSKTKKWRICPADVMAWREEQIALQAAGDTKDLDIEEARRRKIAAEAALAELDLQVRRGEVIEVEEAATLVGDDYANLRAKLLALPTKLAPQVVATEDLAQTQALIESGIYEALEDLTADGIYSDSLTDDSDSDAEEDKPQASAKADRKPVGRRRKKAVT